MHFIQNSTPSAWISKRWTLRDWESVCETFIFWGSELPPKFCLNWLATAIHVVHGEKSGFIDTQKRWLPAAISFRFTNHQFFVYAFTDLYINLMRICRTPKLAFVAQISVRCLPTPHHVQTQNTLDLHVVFSKLDGYFSKKKSIGGDDCLKQFGNLSIYIWQMKCLSFDWLLGLFPPPRLVWFRSARLKNLSMSINIRHNYGILTDVKCPENVRKLRRWSFSIGRRILFYL